MNDLLELVLNRGLPEVMNLTTDAWLSDRKRKPRRYEGRGVPRSFTEDLRKLALELRREGWSYVAIQKEIGINERTLRHYLTPILGKRKPLLTEDQWAEARQLRNMGISCEKIGRMYGVSESCIRRRLER